jgi:hypothetical protein
MYLSKIRIYEAVHLLLLLTVILFVGVRLYQLPDSLLFFGDMGRDFLEFEEWIITGKPPLLGPQTSVLPFNQSAVYFYLMMPLYLLTNKSLYSTILFGIIWYLSFFAIGWWSFRHQKAKLKALLLIGILVSLHPQIIAQSRYLWNPTLALPPIITALFIIDSAIGDRIIERRKMHAIAALLMLSISFTYSTIPTLIAIGLFLLFWYRQQIISIITTFITWGLIWNLPTLVFEIRYRFLLTKQLFIRPPLDQGDVSVATKAINLVSHTVSVPAVWWQLGFVIVSLGALLMIIDSLKLKKTDLKKQFSAILVIMVVVLTFVIPIGIASHYIFGILSLVFYWMSTLKPRSQMLLVLPLLSLWLLPLIQQQYYTPVPRTVSQLLSCGQAFCDYFKEPLYVSNQSGFLNYHNAPEHKYLMTRFGCQVRSIEIEQSSARYMAVVSDDSVYEHGKTDYYELSLFGPSEEIEVFTCQENLKIHLLERS